MKETQSRDDDKAPTRQKESKGKRHKKIVGETRRERRREAREGGRGLSSPRVHSQTERLRPAGDSCCTWSLQPSQPPLLNGQPLCLLARAPRRLLRQEESRPWTSGGGRLRGRPAIGTSDQLPPPPPARQRHQWCSEHNVYVMSK